MTRRSTYAAPVTSTSQSDEPTLYLSLELNQASWLLTMLSPASDKMSKHTTTGNDGAPLIELIDRLRAKNSRLTQSRRH
jgi:transposase